MQMTSKKQIMDVRLPIYGTSRNVGGSKTSMFYIELKLENNRIDIYEIKSFLQCKIKFEPTNPKHEIPRCITSDMSVREVRSTSASAKLLP